MNLNRIVQLTALGMIVTGAAVAGLARRAPALRVAPPIPNGNALQNGCRVGGLKIGDLELNKILPQWASVEPQDQPRVLEGVVTDSLIATTDTPINHQFHDWNMKVKPFPEYEGMLSDAAEEVRPFLGDSFKVIECEWERSFFPEEFWPIPGDTVWTLGRFIFDCGHTPYHTEIHPPKAIAMSRTIGHTFTGDTVPSTVTKTVMYFNAQGGYFYDPIGGQDYKFRVPLPPKPSATAVLRHEIISVSSGSPRPIISSTVNRAEGRFDLTDVLSPADGGQTNTKNLPSKATSGEYLNVTFPLKNFVDRPPTRWSLYADKLKTRPNGKIPHFAAVIVAGWREPVLTKGYRRLRITLDNFRVNKDHDSRFKGSGEWLIWVRVNDSWQKLGNNVKNDISVDDGKTYPIGPPLDTKSFIVTVPEDGNVSIGTTGFEQDAIDDLFGYFQGSPSEVLKLLASGGKFVASGAKTDNNSLGRIGKSFKASRSNFGIGPHDDRSSTGDFNLRYHIDEIARFNPGQANSR